MMFPGISALHTHTVPGAPSARLTLRRGSIFVHFHMLAILARLMLDGQYHLSTQWVVKQCVCHFISAVLHLIGFTSSTYFTSLLHG
jgi:hypothetical protein